MLEFNNTIPKIKKILEKRNSRIDEFVLEMHEGDDFIDLNVLAMVDGDSVDEESYIGLTEPTREQIEAVKEHFKSKRMKKQESYG